MSGKSFVIIPDDFRDTRKDRIVMGLEIKEGNSDFNGATLNNTYNLDFEIIILKKMERLSRQTIESSIDNGQAFRIICDGEIAGGLVLNVAGTHGELELLFVSPKIHSKGIGYRAWCLVEKMFPKVKVWETCTPYFEKRNIHFYVNRCGFHIVEFFNQFHRDPHDEDGGKGDDFDGMFRFEKYMSE